MSNPRRTRNRFLVAAVVGAVCLVVAFAMGEGHAHHTTQVLLGVAGVTLVLICGIGTLSKHGETQCFDRMMGGQSVLARWTVDEQRWYGFLRLNAEIGAQQVHRGFLIPRSDEPRPGGVEVIVARDSVMIDGEFHPLPVYGRPDVHGPRWIDGPPPCIEFRCMTAGRGPAQYRWAVRIPIAAGAEAEAVDVYNHFLSWIRQPNPQKHRLRRNVAIIVALVAGGALAGGIWMVRSTELRTATETVRMTVMTALIIGAILTPAALLCALVWHLRGRAAR